MLIDRREIPPRLRVYIAGRSERRAELQAVAGVLDGEGVAVTSRWLLDDEAWALGLASRAKGAEIDLADIDAASGVLSFTEEAGGGTGGRHVELGYALAKGKWLWIIGPRENVFHHLGRVQVHPTLADWMRIMLARPMRRAALQAVR